VDIIIPFVYGDGKISRKNTSAILIQVKNNANFGPKPKSILFELMNPYFLRFFDLDEEDPVPVIRMVFALASRTSTVDSIPPRQQRRERTAKVEAEAKLTKKSPKYTAYDIWCAKASSDTFLVIKAADEDVYAKLLKVCKVFPAAYSLGIDEVLPSVSSLRRSMNPGTAADPSHWKEFCDTNVDGGLGEFPDDVDFDDEEDEEDE
jgi:hypothetical protein